MAVSSLVKKIQNIMREDAGVNGNAQRIEQMVWMFFLKIYDAKEEEWELVQENYESIIPDNLKWRNWAVDSADGNALTGTALLSFVNNELFQRYQSSPLLLRQPMVKQLSVMPLSLLIITCKTASYCVASSMRLTIP